MSRSKKLHESVALVKQTEIMLEKIFKTLPKDVQKTLHDRALALNEELALLQIDINTYILQDKLKPRRGGK